MNIHDFSQRLFAFLEKTIEKKPAEALRLLPRLPIPHGALKPDHIFLLKEIKINEQPPEIQIILREIEQIAHSTLGFHPILKKLWDNIPAHSVMNEWIKDLSDLPPPKATTLINCLSGDWIGIGKLLSGELIASEAGLSIMEYLPDLLKALEGQSSYFKEILAVVEGYVKIAKLLDSNQISHSIEEIKTACVQEVSQIPIGGVSYIPLGYCNNQMGHLAIHECVLWMVMEIKREDVDHCRVRVLTSKREELVLFDHESMKIHPAVEWSQVKWVNLLNPTLYQAVCAEPFLTAFAQKSNSRDTCFTLLSTVLLLCRFFKSNIYSSIYPEFQQIVQSFDVAPEHLESLADHVDNSLDSPSIDSDLIAADKRLPLHKQIVSMAPTELPWIKPKRMAATSFYALNLIAFAHFGKKNNSEYKLYKIQQRLALLVHLFWVLDRETCFSYEIISLVEAALKGEQRLLNSLNKVLSTPLSATQRDTVMQIAATYKDWRTRFDVYRNDINFPFHKQYPEFSDQFLHTPHLLAGVKPLSTLHRPTANDLYISMPLEGIVHSPLPKLEAATCQILHEELSKKLKDALKLKNYLRPSEFASWIHTTIFSNLPVPKKECNPYEKMAEGTIEERLELMSVLHEFSLLYFAEAVKHNRILPWHLIDLMKIYRIQCQLMELNVPETQKMSFSWSVIKKALTHRGLDLVDREVRLQLEELLSSFEERSPHCGENGPVGPKKIFPLFDASKWENVTIRNYSEEQIESYRLLKILHLTPYDVQNPISLKGFLDLARFVGRNPEDESDGHSNFHHNRTPQAHSFRIAQQAYMLLINAIHAEPECVQKTDPQNDWSFRHLSPYAFSSVEGWATSLNMFYGKFENDIKLPQTKYLSTHKLHKINPGSLFYKPYKVLSSRHLNEFRPQADIIRTALKEKLTQTDFELLQIAEGPIENSIPLLVAFFEVRPHLLKRVDGGRFFLAVISTGTLLRNLLEKEPAILTRILTLLEKLLKEDAAQLKDEGSVLRLFWSAEVCEKLYQALSLLPSRFYTLQKTLQKELLQIIIFGSESQRGLAAANLLNLYPIDMSVVSRRDIARALFTFGSFQSSENEDAYLNFKASKNAANIGNELFKTLAQTEINQIFLDCFPSAQIDLSTISVKEYPAGFEDLIKSQQRLTDHLIWLEWIEKVLSRYLDWKPNCWQSIGLKKFRLHLKEECEKEKALQEAYKKQIAPLSDHFIMHHNGTTYIEIKKKSYELDWLKGLSWEQRQPKVSGFLPPLMQNDPQLAFLKDMLKVPIKYRADLAVYVPLNARLPLAFRLMPQSVLLQHDQKQYKFVPNPSSICHVPFTLSNMTLWVTEEAASPAGLFCVHAENGMPIPFVGIDEKGAIYSLENPKEGVLSNPVFTDHLRCFTQMGCSTEDLLYWINPSGKVIRVDLPFIFEEQKWTTFEWKNHQWHLKGTDLRLKDISHKDTLPALFTTPYLLLVDSDDNRFALLGEASYRTTQKRLFLKSVLNTWQNVFKGAFERAILIPFGKTNQLDPKNTCDALFLAQLCLASCDFISTKKHLLFGLNPLGRPYSEQELKMIVEILNLPAKDSYLELDYADYDNRTSDAAALRLFCLLHAVRHLNTYPINRETISSPSIHEFLNMFENRVVSDDYCRIRSYWFIKQYDCIYQGAKSIDQDGLEELFSAYDEELFLRYGYFNNSIMNNSFENFYKRLARVPISEGKLPPAIPQKNPRVWESLDTRGFHSTNDFKGIAEQAFNRACPVTSFHSSFFEFHTSTMDIRYLFKRAYQLLIIPKNQLSESDKKDYELLVAYLNRFEEESLNLHLQITRRIGVLVQISIETSIILWEILLFIHKSTSRTWPALPDIPSYSTTLSLKEGPINLASAFLASLEKAMNVKFADLLSARLKKIAHIRGRIVVDHKISIYDQFQFSAYLTNSVPYYLEKVKKEWGSLQKAKQNSTQRLGVRSAEIDAKLLSLQVPVCASDQEALKLIAAKLKKSGSSVRKQGQVVLEQANRLPDRDLQEQLKEVLKQCRTHPTRTIDICIGLALQGNETVWKKECPFAEPALMQSETALYLALATEEQYLKRVHQKLTKCLTGTASQKELSEIQSDLKAQRTYPINSETLLLMAAEYYMDIRLSYQQNGVLKALRNNPQDVSLKGTISKLGMGKGKSTVLAPILLIDQANFNGISFYVVPNALFGTAKDDIQHTLWTKFQRRTELFTFVRDQVNKEYLERTLDQLYRARQEGIILITRSNDLQAAGLMLSERHEIIKSLEDVYGARLKKVPETNADGDYDRWHFAKKRLQDELALYNHELTWIQPILNGIHKYGKFLFDEVAHTFDPRNQLCFPIGSEQPANPLASQVALDLYFDDLPQFEQSVNLESNDQVYCKGSNLNAVLNHLAELQWERYGKELDGISKETFILYVLGTLDLTEAQNSAINAFVKKIQEWNAGKNLVRHQLAQKIAFIKHCLTDGLAGALDATADERYGHSKIEHSLSLVICYECNDTPKEGTRFKYPWETLLKTCQYYRQKWHRPSETKTVLRLIAHKLMETPNHPVGSAAEAIFGKGWKALDLEDAKTVERLTLQLDQGLKHGNFKKEARAIVKLFLAEEVFPNQLKIDPVQLTSTPHELTRLPSQSNGFGGTVTYNAIWPSNVEKHFQEKIEDELRTLYINGKHTCHQIKSGKPERVLQDVRKFTDDKMCALIDVGANLKGYSNEKLAKIILELWPERLGVMFYHVFDKGMSELALMTSKGLFRIGGTDHTLIKETLQKHTIPNPITLYDQAHCIGSNIFQPPGSYGVVFISAQVITDDLHQAAMRLRGLLQHLQFLKFAIPDLMGDKTWTVADVLAKTDHYQAQKESLAHYHGILSQLRAIVIEHYNKAMHEETDLEKRKRFYAASAPFVVEQHGNNLVDSFAAKRQRIPTRQAIDNFHQQLPFATVLPDTKVQETVRNSLKRLLETHQKAGTPLPETVVEGEHQIGETQQRNVTGDKQRLMDEEYERMLPAKSPLPEQSWKKVRKELIKAVPPGDGGTPELPAFYQVNDILSEMKLPPIFDQNILISQNMMRTFRGMGTTFLTIDQKHCHRVLVALHENAYKAVLISEQESSSIQQLLSQNPQKGIWIVEANGNIDFTGHPDSQWSNPFLENNTSVLSLLLGQIMILRGDALHLLRLIDQVQPHISRWVNGDANKRKSIVELFELVLSQNRSDDFQAYQHHPQLKAMLLKDEGRMMKDER